MDDVVETVLSASRKEDWETVRSQLHPYLHWYDARREVRGRNNVLKLLQRASLLIAPSA